MVNFGGLTFLTALVFFNQSDYLKHSNKDSNRLIVACFMRVWNMLTTLLFALEIESNAWGIQQILYYKKKIEKLE